MSAQDSIAEVFDVFLCHNSEDKPAVREIAKRLVKEGIKPWLDEEQIRPGTSFQKSIGRQIESIKSAAVFVGENGFGPWQDQETQALLSQFVKRECPVIPAILPSAKATPESPWTLANLNWVDFRVHDPDPIKQLVWGITGEKPTQRESLIPEKNELSETRRRSSESRLYPPLAELPDRENRTQLEILRRRVMEYWVDAVLKDSLYKEVLISLDKQQKDEFVDAPWKYTVELPDETGSGALADRTVSAIYDATGLLLILGEPGSGKTTTLLDLARTLLDRAGEDIRERVAVILNLSSWKKKQPLAEWISIELSEKYRVPRKIARSWLQQNYLLPLLDGLDEVETSIQPDCVAAINSFIEKSNPSGLVVCCRLDEYRWLPERLKLNGAISLEPLSEDEVTEYLTRGGPELAALREAVNTDPILQELAQSPLMLSVMSLAFQGAGGDELANQKGDSLEERQKQIFRIYVEQMFHRKGRNSIEFTKEKIIGWLSWVAGRMREHSQSVFLAEELQPSWLGPTAKRAIYGTVVSLSFGLLVSLLVAGTIVGLNVLGLRLSKALIQGLSAGLIASVGVALGCWSESPLRNGIVNGSIGGLIIGLISGLEDGLTFGLTFGLFGGLGVGSLNHISLVETISWNWNQFWKSTIPGSIIGVIVGLIFGLIVMLTVGRLDNMLNGELMFAVIFELIFGLIGGLVGGFTETVKARKASPNQGIKLSLGNSLAAFLVTWLTVGVIFGVFIVILYWFGGGLIFGLREPLVTGLVLGLIVGAIFGLNRGGSAVIKHYALRLILSLKGYTPFNFIKLLEHCSKLILLKKVGGGYIFIHRMLLDYFAELPTQDGSNKSASVRSKTMLGLGKLFFSARKLLSGYFRWRRRLLFGGTISQESALLSKKESKLLRFGGTLLIAACVVDFVMITYPQIKDLLDSKVLLSRWPMPPALKSDINRDLNLLLVYVVGGEFAKWVIVFAWFCAAILTIDMITVFLNVCLRHFSRAQGGLDIATLHRLGRDLFRGERIANLCLCWLCVTIILAAFFSFSVEGVETWLPVTFFIIFALIETWKSRQQNRLIFALPRVQQAPAFNWLAQGGWHDFLAPFLGGLACVYFLLPALYVAALLLLNKVLHPLVRSVAIRYGHEIFAAVKQHHTVILNGLFGLTIPNFDMLYTPKSGVGQLWSSFVPIAVPYIVPGLLVLLVSRLGIPWSFSFNSRKAFLSAIVSFLLAAGVAKGFQYAVEHWLGMPVTASPALGWVPVVLVIMFAPLFKQSLIERSTYCQNPGCGHRNPGKAEFCNKCGFKLRPKASEDPAGD